MRRDPRAFLWDVREAAADIATFIAVPDQASHPEIPFQPPPGSATLPA